MSLYPLQHKYACHDADLASNAVTTFLIYSLCRPVGGLAPKSQSACRSGNATSSESGTSPSSTGMSPPITPFTGQGSVVGATSVGVLLSVFAGAIMGLLFWL